MDADQGSTSGENNDTSEADKAAADKAAADKAAADKAAAAPKRSRKKAAATDEQSSELDYVVAKMTTSRYGDVNSRQVPRGALARTTAENLDRLGRFEPSRARAATKGELAGVDVAALPILA